MQASIPIASPGVEPERPKRLSVGTLTYTAAGLAVLFLWLLGGDFAWNMKERAIIPMAQIVLRAFAAPDWLVGLLVGSIPAGMGLVLGPVVGVKSDRHRGRWGRRVPFIFAATPVIVLAMFGLAATPDLGRWLVHRLGPAGPSEGACKIAVFALFWTTVEIASTVTNTLFNALINDVVPRAVIGRFFALFRLVGLAAGIVFNYGLVGKAESHARSLFIGLGLLYGAGLALMCLGVREGEYGPPPPEPAFDARAGLLRPLIAYARDCFSKPYYLWFFAAMTFGTVAFVPVNTFTIYHARSVGMPDDVYGKCIALSYAISMVISYPLGILADRFHPVRLGVVFTVAYAIVAAFGFAYSLTANAFFVALLLHTVISGCYFTGTASMAQRLLPQARFAELWSAANVCMAVGLTSLPPTLGVFAQRMHHEYRYMFLLGSAIAAIAAFVHVVLLRKYRRLGGDGAYVAP